MFSFPNQTRVYLAVDPVDMRKSFDVHLRLIRATAERLRRKARPKSNAGKACDYLFGQWNGLIAQ